MNQIKTMKIFAVKNGIRYFKDRLSSTENKDRKIPDGVVERIEDIIVTLEEKLIKLLEGEVELVDSDGKTIRHHPTKFSICGCGKSKTILCDGSHKPKENENEEI